MHKPNPFRMGPPVHGEDFFGRTSQLDEVLRKLETRSALNIFGLRRIGKTSMRLQIVYLCEHDPRWGGYRPISVDGLMFSPSSDFRHLAQRIAHELEIPLGRWDKVDAWLKIRDTLAESNGESILLLDEAEIFGRLLEPDTMPMLRALTQEGVINLVFFTAYYTFADIITSRTEADVPVSQLYNIFSTLRLPVFTLNEAETLLATQFERSELVINKNLSKQLAEYVGGFPAVGSGGGACGLRIL